MVWRLSLGLFLLILASGGAKYAYEASQRRIETLNRAKEAAAALPATTPAPSKPQAQNTPTAPAIAPLSAAPKTAVVPTTPSAGTPGKPSAVMSLFEKLDTENRLTHARELLGKYYKGSVVRSGEMSENIDKFLHSQVERRLQGKWKQASPEIYATIKSEARRYGFDPLFLVAVIDGESSFKPEIKGPVGEIGMMQLREETAKWIAEMMHMPWRGKQSLKDPIVNIQLGAAYLAYLRDKFDDHGQLYVAAYNMGARNVKKALNKNLWPKDYSRHVMHRYVKLYTKLKSELLGTGDLDRTSASETGVSDPAETKPATPALPGRKPSSVSKGRAAEYHGPALYELRSS